MNDCRNQTVSDPATVAGFKAKTGAAKKLQSSNNWKGLSHCRTEWVVVFMGLGRFVSRMNVCHTFHSICQGKATADRRTGSESVISVRNVFLLWRYFF